MLDTKSPAKGIRRHGAGWQVSVYVTGHPRSYKQFPIDTPLEEMLRWQRDERGRLRLTAPQRQITRGGFAADARRYLEAVRGMPSYQMRKRDIMLWVRVFGSRRRNTITAAEIRRQRDLWHNHGPKRVWRPHQDGRRGGEWIDIEAPLAASTVNHRLRALANLYTVLDGRHAPNPAREVPELEEDDGQAYGLPYDLIEAILAAMPDRGRGERGQQRPEMSLSKIRARAIAYTGLSHAELMRLTPERVDLEAAWVDTGRRRKGKGVLTGRRPLTPLGVEAMRQFIAANAWGKFSPSAMRKAIKGACERLAAQIELQPGGAEVAAVLRRLRPYDLRHSYVSEVLQHSGDFLATQLLAGHADLRTTMRYARRAVDPALRTALDKVIAAGGFRIPARPLEVAARIRAETTADAGT